MNAAGVRSGLGADWAAIVVVVFGASAFSISQGLTYPLISLILAERNVSPGMIGLNGAVFSAGLALATLLIGPLTTLIRGPRLIVAALIGVSISLAVFASSEALWVWFIARFTLGFCASTIFTISEAWLNTACPDYMRGRVSGLYGAGICGGFAAGPLAIPLFGTQEGFAFAMLAVYIAFVAFVTVVLNRRVQTEPEASSGAMFFTFIRRAPLLVAMVLAFGFADIAAISGMPVYFTELGYSQAFAATSVTVLALPTALAQPLVGLLLDKVSRKLVAVLAALLTATCFLTLPLQESPLAILLNFAVLGAASFGLYTAALTLLGERYTGGMLVAGSAAYGLAYSVGSAGGSSIFGAAMQMFTPAGGPIVVGCGMLVFAAAFALLILRKSA